MGASSWGLAERRRIGAGASDKSPRSHGYDAFRLGRFELATADAVIYATAIEFGADLLTCGAHFDGLPEVA